MRRYLFIGSFLLSTSILSADPYLPKRVTVRTLQGTGVGFDQGYSSADLFLSSSEEPEWNCWVPFLDLRAHLFNNGKPAVNAGVGLRYVTDWVWGINVYYDYRMTEQDHYNQFSAGFEVLGKMWEFRVNGYHPVGRSESSSHHHHREIAMKGANAEFGVHLERCNWGQLYFAAGPYYFGGHAKATWGGEGRMVWDCIRYLRLEGNFAYDHLFKWTGSGQIGLIWSFGGNECNKKSDDPCCEGEYMKKRTVQRIDRNEIVVVDKKH